MSNHLTGSCRAAGERFFRLYHRHCIEPDPDTLFNLLNALHSLNDRLRKETATHFFDCAEFITLKALRNLFHHETELIHEVRVIPVNILPTISTDMLFLCLVPRHLIEKSIEQAVAKGRANEEQIIRGTLKWYGGVVNINPCIFNFAVHVYERVKVLDVRLEGDGYAAIQASYQLEEENGCSHFITGDISCLAGNVEEVLAVAFANIA